jgi:hypothetical protein
MRESAWRLEERGAGYAIPVPRGAEVEVAWELISPDPTTPQPRTDLACTPRDIRWQGDTLFLPVHNIGAADAHRVRVTVSAEGLSLRVVDVPLIPASADLAPSVVTVRVPVPPTAMSVIVEVGTPEREITLLNNRLTLRRETR